MGAPVVIRRFREMTPTLWAKWLFDRWFNWDGPDYSVLFLLFLLFIGALANFPLGLALRHGDEQCPCGPEVWLWYLAPPAIAAYVIPLIYTYAFKRPWGPGDEQGSSN